MLFSTDVRIINNRSQQSNILMNINLKEINCKHLNSKDEAFEELCCQLFELHGLEKDWNSTAKFIRKGHGADGGIESYWAFDQGLEYGMQAKFPDISSKLPNLWTQIDKSVQTALKKTSQS